MFLITDAQQKIFQQNQKTGFVIRIVAAMQRYWPDEYTNLGETDFKSRIELAIQQALKYGIKSEFNIARYVCLSFLLKNPNFDQQIWAARILHIEQLSADFRMNHLWEAAKKQANTD